ncbi:MAG: HAD family hydrolase [Phycisphaerae bacterium]
MADRAIVFDLDDTLYPERMYVFSGYCAVGDYLRITQQRVDPFDDWLWYRFCSGQSAGAFDALNEEFELGLDKDEILELVQVYRNHTPTLGPFDGIPELLDQITGSAHLALLSDGFLPAQKLKLQALQMESSFEAVVFTEELGREFWKPSPAGFEKIARQLDVPSANCIYVGDNPAKDFVAPNRLGWRTIQYIREEQIHAGNPAPTGGEPQTIVRDDRQLLDALG